MYFVSNWYFVYNNRLVYIYCFVYSQYLALKASDNIIDHDTPDNRQERQLNDNYIEFDVVQIESRQNYSIPNSDDGKCLNSRKETFIDEH